MVNDSGVEASYTAPKGVDPQTGHDDGGLRARVTPVAVSGRCPRPVRRRVPRTTPARSLARADTMVSPATRVGPASERTDLY
jgi:hypothetical protein